MRTRCKRGGREGEDEEEKRKGSKNRGEEGEEEKGRKEELQKRGRSEGSGRSQYSGDKTRNAIAREGTGEGKDGGEGGGGESALPPRPRGSCGERAR